MAKNKIITHPILGTLKSEGAEWVGKVKMPTWAKPPFCDKDLKGKRSEEFEVTFWLDHCGASMEPTPAQISSLLAVVQSESELTKKVVDAIWDEFQGQSPSSIYWWNGDLAQVNETIGYAYSDDESLIEQKEDVWKFCYLQSISVGYQSEKSVELCLKAEWEEEHGVGVLVEGSKVAGVGYGGDVLPYGADGSGDETGEKEIFVEKEILSLEAIMNGLKEQMSDRAMAIFVKPQYEVLKRRVEKMEKLKEQGVVSIGQGEYMAMSKDEEYIQSRNKIDSHIERLEVANKLFEENPFGGMMASLAEGNKRTINRLKQMKEQGVKDISEAEYDAISREVQ